MEILSVLKILLLLVFIKSLTVGSDFSFVKWIKYKKQYTYWYFNRPVFKA
jgi:hypothetical protein